jgi:hypothetical protein
MTEAQLAALRGPIAASDEIPRQSVLRIASATPANIPPTWLELFRNAATTGVLQATKFARVSREPRLRRFGANDPA